MQFDYSETRPTRATTSAAAGAGLPSYFNPVDQVMPPGDYPIPDNAADEIAERGFCLFKMADRRSDAVQAGLVDRRVDDGALMLLTGRGRALVVGGKV
jgi:hypothetical protein